MAEPNYPDMRDFSLKERRHFAGGSGGGAVPRGQQSSLGLGMVPVQEEKLLPHSIRREAAPPGVIPSNPLLDPPQEPAAASTSKSQSDTNHWVTSYMAQSSGETERKRATGKKTYNQQPAQGLSSFIGFGGPTRPTPSDDAALQLGTTKASNHIPGYTGHIQHKPQTGPVAERNLDKSIPLLTQGNYHPVCAGYTGRRK